MCLSGMSHDAHPTFRRFFLALLPKGRWTSRYAYGMLPYMSQDRFDPAPGAQDHDHAEHAMWPAIRRGLTQRCPGCGKGEIFKGYLT